MRPGVQDSTPQVLPVLLYFRFALFSISFSSAFCLIRHKFLSSHHLSTLDGGGIKTGRCGIPETLTEQSI